MEYKKLSLPGLVLFKPKRHVDSRGYFSESFRQSLFEQAVGEGRAFVQDNQSFSKEKNTLRGLHYQLPPHAQGKLVQCSQGSILDVAVDARAGSPAYGQHIAVELSAKNGHQLWLPAGFLHGFITREANSLVHYKCTDYYNAACDAAVLWNDPDLAIEWGLEGRAPILSQKDQMAETFDAFNAPFEYEDRL